MTLRDSGWFEDAYRGTPPWEIGAPQQAFLDTVDSWRGRVLDAGCGTGELALAAAARGLAATGIDGAPSAIAIAKERAVARGLDVDFRVGDVLRLPEPAGGSAYDLVFDSGLFHVFTDAERARYVAGLTGVTAIGGRLLLLCFSDRQDGDWGPRRVSRAELERAFANGWQVDSIEPARFVMANTPSGIAAAASWFGQFTRI
jgi:SAM-dependent methyltransferase